MKEQKYFHEDTYLEPSEDKQILVMNIKDTAHLGRTNTPVSGFSVTRVPEVMRTGLGFVGLLVCWFVGLLVGNSPLGRFPLMPNRGMESLSSPLQALAELKQRRKVGLHSNVRPPAW